MSSSPITKWDPVVYVVIGVGIRVAGVAVGRFDYRLRNLLGPTTSTTLRSITGTGDNSRDCIVNFDSNEVLSTTPSVLSLCSLPSGSGEVHDELRLCDASLGVSCSHVVQRSRKCWDSGVDNPIVDALKVDTETTDTSNTSDISDTTNSTDIANSGAGTSEDYEENTDTTTSAANEDKYCDGDKFDDGNDHSAVNNNVCASGYVEKIQRDVVGKFN